MSIDSRRRGDLGADVTRAATQNDKLLVKKKQDKTTKDGIAFIIKHMAVFDQAKTVIMVGFFPRLKQNMSSELTEKTRTFCKIANYIKKYENGTDLRTEESTQAMSSWKDISNCLNIYLGPFRKKVFSYTKYEFAYDFGSVKTAGSILVLLSKFHMMVSTDRFCVPVPNTKDGKMPLDIGIFGKTYMGSAVGNSDEIWLLNFLKKRVGETNLRTLAGQK